MSDDLFHGSSIGQFHYTRGLFTLSNLKRQNCKASCFFTVKHPGTWMRVLTLIQFSVFEMSSTYSIICLRLKLLAHSWLCPAYACLTAVLKLTSAIFSAEWHLKCCTRPIIIQWVVHPLYLFNDKCWIDIIVCVHVRACRLSYISSSICHIYWKIICFLVSAHKACCVAYEGQIYAAAFGRWFCAKWLDIW